MVTSYSKVKLLSRLSVNELKAIKKGFPVAKLGTSEDEPKRNVEQFCDLLSSILTDANEAEFRELFEAIDTDKEGFIDWDKFCSYMQQDYQEKDDRLKTTQVPQWRELKYVTSSHKESIQRITTLMNPSRYITLSKEGVIVVWNLNMKSLRTIYVTTEPDQVKQRDLWITDFAPMQNIYKLALALTSKEIAIYDLSSKSEFLCQYRIRGLKSTPISLNSWANPENPNESILVFGDVSGKVNALIFCASTISLFDRPAQSHTNQQDVTSIVELSDIAKGRYQNCRYVYHHGHTEWTRQVMYTSLLDCFISCATNYKNAVVLGWMEKTKSNMRTTTFRISQGVNAFDYNEKMNLIATAGVNHHVLLWNPYVISKPVGVLRGHMQSVVSVKFIQTRGQTISLSKDKVLRIWDTHLQVCLQRLSGMFPKGPEVSTVMYFDEERSKLLTAFNHRLSVMVMKPEVKDRIISHEHPVIGAIYNRKFNQVISACVGSVVTMWMVDTGQKLKQFTNAHGNSEITTITQDASETRLFTGSADGTVKIWDFNGHCHHILVAGDGNPCDITEVLPLKRMILVVGWDRTLCVFRDSQLTSYYVHPSDWKGRQEHQDDIQCMSFNAPHTLASASYDGELVLWNTNSEQAFRHLGCKARKTTRTNRRLRKLEQSGSALSRSHDERLAPPPISEIIGDDVSTICTGFDDSQGENEADMGCFVSKLIFLNDRSGPATSNAANLVCCGASGWVRFWDTDHNVCLGEFVAHAHAGAITMAVDQLCRYLATGDGDGLVKVWNISEYCTQMSDEPPETEMPPLHKQFQPHLDSITSIEIFERFDRLLLLTSSSDCSVAVWDIHGRQLGVFGQEEHWKIENISMEQPSNDDEEAEDNEVISVFF